MTDEIDVLRQTISEYEEAKHIKNMNEELLHHLSGSIFYLLRHSEKYNIPLPKKDELIRMLDRANSLINEITRQPKINRGNTDTDKLTGPVTDIFNKVLYRTLRYGR